MGLEEIRKLKEQAKLPKQPKPRRAIAKKSEKKLKQEAEEKEILKETEKLGLSTGIPDQEQWFEDRMRESLPVCMNCGLEANWLLQPEYKKIWRACQAHILPKRKAQFPSVATHPLNHMVLFPVWGGHLCGCHDEYDSGWYNATTMKAWEIAKHRFKEFQSAIAPAERRKIPEQFLK
jgi:hypothetical protein